jgi:hypothetical protein
VREAQQLFQQQLSLLAGKADPSWEMFENVPLREFLTQANHLCVNRTSRQPPGQTEGTVSLAGKSFILIDGAAQKA